MPAASPLCIRYCLCCNTEGVSSRHSQKQSPQIGSPDGEVSVHLEETRFNQLSDHPPPVSSYPHLHLHIESMSVSISLFEPSHRLLLTATQKGQFVANLSSNTPGSDGGAFLLKAHCFHNHWLCSSRSLEPTHPLLFAQTLLIRKRQTRGKIPM